jgi:hypothetical protein
MDRPVIDNSRTPLCRCCGHLPYASQGLMPVYQHIDWVPRSAEIYVHTCIHYFKSVPSRYYTNIDVVVIKTWYDSIVPNVHRFRHFKQLLLVVLVSCAADLWLLDITDYIRMGQHAGVFANVHACTRAYTYLQPREQVQIKGGIIEGQAVVRNSEWRCSVLVHHTTLIHTSMSFPVLKVGLIMLRILRQ